MQVRDGVYEIPSDSGPSPLDRALRGRFTEASWSSLRKLVLTGKIEVNGQRVTDPTFQVRPGDRVRIHMAAPRAETRTVASESIVYADAHVVVADKPSGIMTVPFEDERDTFVDRVKRALEKRAHHSVPPLGVVHRIDKATSGLLVFTRRPSAKRALEQQFRLHTVHRVYLALVHGSFTSRTIRSRLVKDRGDGLRGSTTNPKLGQPAVTHVTAVEQLSGATLVRCQLETGRTHQIRIHLSEAGHPLLGEEVYIRHFAGPVLEAPRLMLHAAELGFLHPTNERELRFTSELPPDFRDTLARLRKTRSVAR